MRSLWRSLKPRSYSSTLRCASDTHRGVTFTIRRMSLGRRIELAQAIRELAQKMEFHQAGDSAKEHVEAAAISARIDLVYLKWGLTAVAGLLIDGEPVTAKRLYADGPEDLTREIVNRVKRECGLTDEE